MYLKKLEILGFKSFAERIKMDFKPGITAIVGPNGCGKSNVADAFRWVLGEQSAKSMRGSKMSDLIFAGTTDRKPLNFAEVEITLADLQGWLPVPYEELAVMRRLHRSGESEYFINRQPVRLKDIQGLFLDSGVGKDAYAIFEQGKIDEVINLPPVERRRIFEEAAGILRFLQRKREALKKLEQAEYNIARIKDIHQEVERQIATLEGQALQARAYKEQVKQLERLEKVILLAKWEALQRALSELESKAEQVGGLVHAGNQQLERQQQQLGAAKHLLEETASLWRQSEQEHFHSKTSQEIAIKEKQHHAQRLSELQAHEQRWAQEIAQLVHRRQLRQADRQAGGQRKGGLDEKLTEAQTSLKVQREQVSTLDKEVALQRDQLMLKQRELLKSLQAEKQLENEAAQLEVRIEMLTDRQQQIRLRQGVLAKSTGTLGSQSSRHKESLDKEILALAAEKERFSEMENTLGDLNKEIGKLQKELEKANQKSTETKARQKALQALHDSREGFSSGSKKLLEASSSPSSPFFKKIRPLYEFFTSSKGADSAVEEPLMAVMRQYAHTLVIEKQADFDQLLEHIAKAGIKEVSLICLERIAKLAQTAKAKPSKAAVSLAEYFENHLLVRHFLNEAYLVDSPEIALPGHLWTNAGFLIDRKGVFFFVSKGEGNVFSREAELKQLGQKLADHEKKKGELDLQLRTMQQERNQVQLARSELDKALRKQELKLMELQFELQKVIAEAEKVGKEEKQLDKELSEAEASQKRFTERLALLKQEQEAVKAASAALQAGVDAGNETYRTLSQAARREGDALRRQESAMHQLSEELQKQVHALNVLEIKDLESLQQEKQLAEEIERAQAERTQIQLRGAELQQVMKTLAEQLLHVSTVCKEYEQQVAARKTAVNQLESKMHEARHSLKKQETEKQRLQIQSAQLKTSLTAVEKEMSERFAMQLEQLRAELHSEAIAVEKAEQQAKVLKQQIEGAGNVNLLAIEECDKQRARFQFLDQQMGDLNGSKQELLVLIAQLDQESAKLFKDSFELVRTNFKKNFKILFNGGEADLQLTEGANPLEAGVEIIAQPPGKQMRGIQLLSGGEKCLTAIALLFAIFEVKPSPFCILDEIDAPLDDANVERFVNIVKLFVDRCQFVIITHNKRTMAIADKIFGISMEQKGISKLLSIDFTKDREPELVGA